MKIFLIKISLLAGIFFVGGLNLLIQLVLSFVEMIEEYSTKICSFFEEKLENYERKS